MTKEFVEALENVNPEITRNEGKSLTGVIDSLDIMNIVSVLEDTFGAEFEPEDIIPENFESLEAIWNILQERRNG